MPSAENDAGLEGRYYVKKLNDAAHKHDECRYFVLDPRHDPLALQALKYYARLARDAGHTALAVDLDVWTRDETERFIAPRVTPPVEHELEGTACSCGEWEAKLGESIHRGFDRHLLEARGD